MSATRWRFCFYREKCRWLLYQKRGGADAANKVSKYPIPAMTAIFMAYGMIVYRIAIHSSEGLSIRPFSSHEKNSRQRGFLFSCLRFLLQPRLRRTSRLESSIEKKIIIWYGIVSCDIVKIVSWHIRYKCFLPDHS